MYFKVVPTSDVPNPWWQFQKWVVSKTYFASGSRAKNKTGFYRLEWVTTRDVKWVVIWKGRRNPWPSIPGTTSFLKHTCAERETVCTTGFWITIQEKHLFFSLSLSFSLLVRLSIGICRKVFSGQIFKQTKNEKKEREGPHKQRPLRRYIGTTVGFHITIGKKNRALDLIKDQGPTAAGFPRDWTFPQFHIVPYWYH